MVKILFWLFLSMIYFVSSFSKCAFECYFVVRMLFCGRLAWRTRVRCPINFEAVASDIVASKYNKNGLASFGFNPYSAITPTKFVAAASRIVVSRHLGGYIISTILPL